MKLWGSETKWRWKNMFIQIIWTNLSSIKPIAAQFCQVNPDFTFWNLSTTAGRNIIPCSLYSVLSLESLMLHTPLGLRASCPWPKCVKANWGGDAAAPLLQLPAWHRQLRRQRPLCWKEDLPSWKNSKFRLSSREEMGSPSSPSRQCRRDVLSCPGRGAPAGVRCCTALSPCSPENLSGVSLQWAVGLRSPLPHQQQFKLWQVQ